MIEVNRLSWTLEPVATELPLDENNSITIHPGDDYPPGYTGSKFTIRRIQNKYQFSLKSYGNYVDAKTLQKSPIYNHSPERKVFWLIEDTMEWRYNLSSTKLGSRDVHWKNDLWR